MYGDPYLDVGSAIIAILGGLLFVLLPIAVYLELPFSVIFSMPFIIFILIILTQWISDSKNGYRNINPNNKNPRNISRPDLYYKYKNDNEKRGGN